MGRYTLPPPRTTKRRATTNLKTKSNKNCQKIELYGSPTTKELKKKDSHIPVGGAETGSQAERTWGKVAAEGLGGQEVSWQTRMDKVASGTPAVPHLHADNQEEQRESEIDCKNQGSSTGK